MRLRQTQVDILSQLIPTDKASFHLSGKAMRHNTRFRGEETPEKIADIKRFSTNVTIWVAIIHSSIHGP